MSDKPYKHKENTGSTFKNDRKQNESQPDMTGSCNIDGVDYWMSMWIKKLDSGKILHSFSFQKKEPKGPEPAKTQEEFDDDIPF